MKINPTAALVDIRQFTRIYGLVARQAFLMHKVRFASIIVASMGGAFAQGATIWLLSLILRVMEDDLSIQVPMTSFTLEQNFASLAFIVAVLFALQLASAVLLYASAIQARAVARSYHQKMALRTLRAYCAAPSVSCDLFSHVSSPIRRSIVRNPKIMGKAVENMATSIRTVFLAIAYIIVMFTLTVEISLCIIPAFVLVMPFLYRLGTSTQEAARSYYDRAVKNMSAHVRRQIQVGGQTNLHRDLYPDRAEQTYLDDPVVRQYYDYYDRLLLSVDRSVLITGMFRPLLLTAILLVLGWFALADAYPWSVILPFVLALFQLMNNVQSLAATIAVFHRHYPRILQYFEVVPVIEDEAIRSPSHADPARSIDIAGTQLVQGDVALYFTEMPLTLLTFQEVLRPLRDASSGSEEHWRYPSFVGKGYVPPSVSLHDMLPETRGWISELLVGMGLSSEIDLDTPLDEAMWMTLSPEVQSTIIMLDLRAADSEVVFLDAEILGMLRPDFVASLLDLLAGKILVLVSAHRRTECERAKIYLQTENGHLTGSGDAEWWRQEREKHRESTRRQRVPEAVIANGLDEEDDEDEDL
jgi:hypothetical protein